MNGQSNSTNFTGIVVGPGSGGDSVTYTATAEVPTALRTGTHAVTATASGGDLVVTVDGTQLLSTPVTLPPQVLVGFTAGTGELADTHIVSGVQITTGGSAPTPNQPLSANPTALDFGSETVGSTTNQTVTLTNTGSATETVTAATTPLAPFGASVPATGTTVAPGSSITVPVSFAPTATGTFTSDGLSFALLDSSATTVTSLGSAGSSLGVGGLPAVFVAFQTYSGNDVYAGNYVSVGTSAAGGSGLTLLGTNKSIPTLRGTPHTIGIQVTTAGHVVVSIDGVQVLDVAVPSLPPSVRVAFTGGTGGLTDTHAISAPTVTYSS